MYERSTQPLLSRTEFAKRVGRQVLLALGPIAVALAIGVVGYHVLGELSWLDSFLNASMILGGMGPVDPLKTSAAKFFAACYALFSGLFFIGMLGFILTPFAHRLMHHFHVDDEDDRA